MKTIIRTVSRDRVALFNESNKQISRAYAGIKKLPNGGYLAYMEDGQSGRFSKKPIFTCTFINFEGKEKGEFKGFDKDLGNGYVSMIVASGNVVVVNKFGNVISKEFKSVSNTTPRYAQLVNGNYAFLDGGFTARGQEFCEISKFNAEKSVIKYSNGSEYFAKLDSNGNIVKERPVYKNVDYKRRVQELEK